MTVLAQPDVLVVDDNEDALFATVRVLERNGLAVVSANDGSSAWEVVNDTRPRVVLLDVILPDTDGFEVLRRIRAVSELDETSIVMLSSMRTSILDRTDGLNAGADGYLIRPIDNDELVARVRAQLRQHELLGRLRRSEQRYRDMIDSQIDGVLVVDRDGMVRYANPSADVLFAEDPDGLTSQPFGAPISGGSTQVELRRSDGTSVPVEMSVVDTDWDEIPVWLITLHDITERLRLEEQLRLSQRLESVGRLTGGIAHDFNNLLAVILGASSELTSRTDGDLAELSEMIAQAAERGAELTNRLVAFAGRQNLEPSALDVHQLVHGMLPVLRRSLGDAIDIELNDDGTTDWAIIDRAGLESAVLNLCLNGRDAMSVGGRLDISIGHHVSTGDTSSARHGPGPGRYVALSVTDHGDGIAPDHLDRVLEPFFTTKPLGHGTGLGLPMVYGFVGQSGGHLDIDSEVGRGTTVTMYLPAIDAPAEGSDDVADGPAEVDDESADVRDAAAILVVDDEDLLRGLVIRQIERFGDHALGAAGADEALQVLRDAHVDLLLSDVRLGGDVSGHELALRALELRPQLAVLLMSGLVEEARRADGTQFDVLGKPFTLRQLGDAINRALGR